MSRSLMSLAESLTVALIFDTESGHRPCRGPWRASPRRFRGIAFAGELVLSRAAARSGGAEASAGVFAHVNDDLFLLGMGAAGGLALAATAQLPDPGQPSVVPLSAAVVGFLFVAQGKARRLDSEELRRLAFEGGFYGAAFGVCLYLWVLAA